LYWDDEDLSIEQYDRNKKFYSCGKKLVRIEKDKKLKYTVVIIDLSETYCANIYEDGEIEKLFHFDSHVPRKHKAGGQSQHRFERDREQAIIQYFNVINNKLKDIDTQIIIAINFIYKNWFSDYLSTENKNKILKFVTTEYGGETGIYQFRNMN
jgi:peptide chain release factor subunit 1